MPAAFRSLGVVTEPFPSEEQGGDPPCWAAQFDDAEDGGESEPASAGGVAEGPGEPEGVGGP